MRQKEDKFSILPKMILHDIMSRLPEKDAARISVLSKAWADTWYTFPILSFCDTRNVGDSLREEKSFVDYVNRSLRRFSDQGLTIKKFKLCTRYFKADRMSKDIDLWLKLACESGAEVLKLCILGLDQHYVLPARVINEAKSSITKLVLRQGIRVDHALFMNHSIKLFSLRVLSLRRVLMEDEHAIEHLISCCPLIEDITLIDCVVLSSKTSRMLKSLTLHGLQNLKAVNIGGIRDVYIDAPSLDILCYYPGGFGDDMDSPIKMDFDRCQNLRVLHLSCFKSPIITSKWFLELFRKSPFLETLELVWCVMSVTINISSDRLRKLKLSYFFNKTKEINIDAPNLLSCSYVASSYHSKPIISFLRSSSKLEINVYITICYLDDHNVKDFIQNRIKPHNILTSLSLSLSLLLPERVTHVENQFVLQVSSPLSRIKHLYVREVPEDESSFLSSVSMLFSICCPETISLSLDSREFIKFFYAILKGKKEYSCICSSSDTKCWWHDLKDVKVTCSIKIDENADFETMLESLPTYETEQYISFTL